ncbi:MAG: peptidoglycan-binding protein [Oscillospiraceae bacterium]|nr:peptidoglycan-binding protein [Oscillospiraceae bacterium]
MLTGEPFIPENITVHLGRPDQDAENVTLPFPEYIKNVASSEIFPTWPEAALRANIYAIVSFALNRYYTEWYRSRGYDFDITDNTQYDQKFIKGRQIFENISQITDEIFDDYVRRQGSVEPLFTAFCNGTTSTCDGLSQWGTVALAEDGLVPYEILTYYYGNDIEIVRNAPVRTGTPSYPGFPISLGYVGNETRNIQVQLNRISRNYPVIPKIGDVSGDFDYATEEAVRTFQEVFNLPATGIVDKATWNKISYIFTSVKKLAELDSEGLRAEEAAKQFTETLSVGMQSQQVRNLQYYLAVIGAYYEDVLPVDITGYFGADTENSVKSFQRVFGLPETGIVDRNTARDIYRAYFGILDSLPAPDPDIGNVVLFPGVVLREGASGEYVRILQTYLSYIHQTYPEINDVSPTGYFGPVTRSAVTAFQRLAGLPENGIVGSTVWDEISKLYSDLRFGMDKRPFQSPGYTISGDS